MFSVKNILGSKCFTPLNFLPRAYQITFKKKYIKPPKKSTLRAKDAHLQVLGSGAADQPASVLLQAVDQLYLFNCGEGIGRMSKNAGISLTKINHAFFTQSKWERIGGVTSLFFSCIASTGYLPTFYGPDNLGKILKRMSFLSVVGGIYKHRFTHDQFKNERFEDVKLVVEPVELKHQMDSAIIYVCKLKMCQGSFSLRKSIEKNVPPHLVAHLHRGKNVILDDGTLVKSSDVKNPDWPEMYIIFLDIPHKGFLKDLATNEKFKNLMEQTKSTGIEVVVHFTPKNVFHTKRYQHFMEIINPKKNLVVNDSNKFSTTKSIDFLQSKLNKIDPKMHSPLGMKLESDPKIYDPFDTSTEQYKGNIPTFYSKYILRSVRNDDILLDESSDDDDDDDESSDLKEMMTSLHNEDVLPPITQEICSKLKDETFPRILFLGTGAADSFMFRNSSATLVHLSPNHSILLDCGTATSNQINRYYGDEAPEIYRRLKAVYVSHMHLDHHIGLPEIFKWRKSYLPMDREPLRIFCPFEDMKSWLLFYANYIDPIYSDMKFIDNDILLRDLLNIDERLYLNIDSMRTCAVDHFKKSYALTMEFTYRNGDKMKKFKLSYSGDGGRCDDFVKLGQNSDLLIHEATFQSEMIELAKKHRHSTVEMAIEQGQKMNAKYTILTHFSTRYHIVPYIEGKLDDKIGIAFDFMEVTPDDLPRLTSLYAKYTECFPDAVESLKRKTKNYLFNNGLE